MEKNALTDLLWWAYQQGWEDRDQYITPDGDPSNAVFTDRFRSYYHNDAELHANVEQILRALLVAAEAADRRSRIFAEAKEWTLREHAETLRRLAEGPEG